MDQITLILAVGGAALVAGAAIGVMIGKSGASATERNALEKQLKDTRAELDTYKEQVNEHFSKTAELVNNLSESYRDVYKHLASSAEQLCESPQFSLRLEQNLPTENRVEQTTEEKAPEQSEAEATSEENKADTEAGVEAPKDYAPKATPDEEGTLSENFGLKGKADDTEPQPAADHPKAS